MADGLGKGGVPQTVPGPHSSNLGHSPLSPRPLPVLHLPLLRPQEHPWVAEQLGLRGGFQALGLYHWSWKS